MDDCCCSIDTVAGQPTGGGGGGTPTTVTLQEALDGQNALGVPTDQAYDTELILEDGNSWIFEDSAGNPVARISGDGVATALQVIGGQTAAGAGQNISLAAGPGTVAAQPGGILSLAGAAAGAGGVDGYVSIPSALALDGIVDVTLGAGLNNNLAPAGGTTANAFRLTPDATGSTITGLTGGLSRPGRLVVLFNISTTIPIGINHDSTSTASNRFLLPQGATYSIPPNSAVVIWYDNTSQRWRIVSEEAVSTPGSVLWTFANSGGPADGIITTTDATPVFRTWCTLGAVGDTVNFQAFFYGVRSNGDDCLFRQSAGGFGRNAVGSNSLLPVAAVVTSGYDETGLGTAPWNNLVANPAGWGGGVNFLPGGNIIQVAFNGAAGETVQWRCLIIATPFWGAAIAA